MGLGSIPELEREALQSARKSFVATTAIAGVLSVNSGDGINWAVNISGGWAWSFLLIVHTYYWWNWVANGGLREKWPYWLGIVRGYALRTSTKSGQKREYLFFGLVNLRISAFKEWKEAAA